MEGAAVGKKNRIKKQARRDTRAEATSSRSTWTAAGAARRCARFLDAVREPHPALAPVLLQIHLGHADDVERAVADLDAVEAERRRQLLTVGTGLAPQQWHSAMTQLEHDVVARLALADAHERRRLLIRQHQLLLTGRPYPSHTEPFVISPEMHNVVTAAAMTIDTDDLWSPDPHHQPPTPAGMLLLPETVGSNNNVEAPMSVLGWRPQDGPVLPGYPVRRGVWIEGWAQRTDVDRLPIWHYATRNSRALGLPAPAGLPVSQGWIIDDSAGREERDALAQNTQLQDRITDDRRERSAVYDPAGTSPVTFSVSVYLFAFWRLCAQRVTDTTGHDVARTQRRPRTGSPGLGPGSVDHVRVVHLRPGAVCDTEAGRESGSRYHHRWPVRMHKVRQWYPNEQTHRVIFRGPYIKGPDGAPLLTGPRAQAII